MTTSKVALSNGCWRPQFLAGYVHEGSARLHVGLSIRMLVTWPLAPPNLRSDAPSLRHGLLAIEIKPGTT